MRRHLALEASARYLGGAGRLTFVRRDPRAKADGAACSVCGLPSALVLEEGDPAHDEKER